MSRFKWRYHNRCGGTLQSLPIKMSHDSCLNDSALSVSRKRCQTSVSQMTDGKMGLSLSSECQYWGGGPGGPHITMSLSRTISEIERDIAWKSLMWTYPTSIWCPAGGDVVGILPRFLASENYRVLGLLYGIVCVILGLAIFVNSDLWQTDVQTDTRWQLVPC